MSDIFDTEFEGKEIKLTDNMVSVGDDVNLTEKDPTLRVLHLGMGWDLNAFDAEAMDLDISVICLDKNDMTREDDDFIFYNHMQGLNGAVRHLGDSRTGAGDGDDEAIAVNLLDVPFEIIRIIFVLSVYKGLEKEQNLGMVRGAYLRVANEETTHEFCRYDASANLKGRTETAMIMGALNREGPKWHFVPLAEFDPGGLAALATRYGMIIGQQ